MALVIILNTILFGAGFILGFFVKQSIYDYTYHKNLEKELNKDLEKRNIPIPIPPK